MDDRERLIIAQRIDIEAQQKQLQWALGELVTARVRLSDMAAEYARISGILADYESRAAAADSASDSADDVSNPDAPQGGAG